MIIYFADRQFNILGQASTGLPAGLLVSDDLKTEEIETGVAIFECKIHFDADTREKVEAYTKAGNFVLRSHENENEFYTIIDCEVDTKDQTAYIYAEDAGLDLLNEIVAEYEADKAYPISHYIEKFAYDSGFKIGVNEAASLTKQLAWDNEETVTARLASVAAQFDGCEISYSYDVKGLKVTNKYINIHRKRGKDIGAVLRLNKDVESFVTTRSIANLATALRCTGGTIDQDSTVLEAKSSGSPQVAYKVQLETKGRTASTIQMRAKVTAALVGENASLDDGYGLAASVYMGGSWHDVTLKATDKDNKQAWSGTTEHSVEYTFTISGVTAAAITYSDIKFKVSRTDSKGGSIGVLAATNCNSFMIPNYIEGGENGEDIESRAITLEGFKYDDGDFYIDGDTLKSRNALKNWSRYLREDEPNQLPGQQGHIVKLFSYDTPVQSELCNNALKELKSICDMEINYEVEITRLPQNTKIGDRVSIVDEAGKLYLSTRLLQLKVSVAEQSQQAVLGEHLIKTSGINQKVLELAEKFAKNAKSAEKALAIAKDAKNAASNAQAQANSALNDVSAAQNAAANAQTAADAANQSAQEAQTAASNAETAVGSVVEQVTGLENTIANALDAAEQARQAASTAEIKATEAQQAAVNAQQKAEEAESLLSETSEKAEEAVLKAEEAQSTAGQAKQEAEAAATKAEAAKLDAEQAQKDIDSLADSLTTLSNTMSADYARKTDLTDTKASLQTQISQNAAKLQSTAKKLQIIDETANNAHELLLGAIALADKAQEEADQAEADATAAQATADEAEAAAKDAEDEAQTAKQAAETAKAVADDAKAALEAAQADLETVQSRADATEEEIAEAQQAVTAAKTAANNADVEAGLAAKRAAEAQDAAAMAVANASAAQQAANDAVNQASVAQATANEAKGNADAAKATADQAKASALAAQQTAKEAAEEAATAQAAAQQAAIDAKTAQITAEDAGERAEKAAEDLESAQTRLAEVMAKVDATEEEVAAAQADVDAAQSAATVAETEAETARNAADKAREDADEAQTLAEEAQEAANTALHEANLAQLAAKQAEGIVNGLAYRVTQAETDIVQTSEQISLLATKKEVAETLGGYASTEEMQAAIKLSASQIESSVSKTYETKEEAGELATRVTQTEGSITSQASEVSNLKNRVSVVEQTSTGVSVQLYDLNESLNNLGNQAFQQIDSVNRTAIDAAKTATNFMSYDSEGGLQVGNKQSGNWSGYRSQVKSDSFNILDQSGTALAKYGANIIDLGCNSQSTTINLCNGLGKMKYDTKASVPTFGLYSDQRIALRARTSKSNEPESDYFAGVYAAADNTSHVGTYTELKASVYDATTGEAGVEGYVTVTPGEGIYVVSTSGSNPHVEFITPFVTMNDLNVAGDLSVDGNVYDKHGYGCRAISLSSEILTTEDELTTALAAAYDSMGNQETKLVTYAGYPSPSDWRWFGILTRSSANNGSFVAQSAYDRGSQIVKAKYGGTWQQTDWQNPPMVAGTEYRTTERWNSKAVYTKAVNLGTLPNATTKTVTHGASPTAVLRVSAVTSTGTTLPYRSGDSIGEISANRVYLFVHYNYDASSATGTAQMWYTKD